MGEKIKDLFAEKWVPYDPGFEDIQGYIYISNYGRLKRCLPGKPEKLYKPGLVNEYLTFTTRNKSKKTKTKYVHKMVAKHFLAPAEREEQTLVIHKDFDKLNNHESNLEWACQIEVAAHRRKNPTWIKVTGHRPYTKLNEAKVRLIKKKLADPNRKTRLKMIAKQFGISEMQLYRIKTGENWGDVEI